MASGANQNNVAVLGHPLVITCLCGWLLNDWVLKDTFANAATGKLSDVFAMVVFPLLVAVILGPFVSRPMTWSVVFTGVFFSSINLFDAADRVTERALNLVVPSSLTKDPTDLLVLPIMSLAVFLWNQPIPDVGSIRRHVGRAMLVAGVITTTATSAEEPRTDNLTGTFVLTEENPEISMPLEFVIEGEIQHPDLDVYLRVTPYGSGPPGSGGAPPDIVRWETDLDKIVYRMTDASWAPIEVFWSIAGIGILGDSCLLLISLCDDDIPASLSIDAPPDEFGPEPDSILQFPEGSDEAWTVAEATIRFDRSDPPRITFLGQRGTPIATAETMLFSGNSRNLPIQPTATCGDPCELSLWSSYKSTSSPPEYGLYGEVEIVGVDTHELVEVRASPLVLGLPNEGPNYRFEFCLQADLSMDDPIEELTTFISFDKSWDEELPTHSTLPRLVSRFDERCVSKEHFYVDPEYNEFDQLHIRASIWTMADRTPTEAVLIQIER